MIEIIIALFIVALLGVVAQCMQTTARINGLQADIDRLRCSTRQKIQLLSAMDDLEALKANTTALTDALGYEIQQQPSRTVAVKKEPES